MGSDQRMKDRELRRQAADAAAAAKAAKAGRDAGAFVAWIKPVQTSPGWRRASHVARSLLMDMLHSGPNGRLLACDKYLRPLRWTSEGTVNGAVAELIACGLLVLTRRGAIPNVPAWYAATWLHLRHIEGLDIDPKKYKTGGYMNPECPDLAPNRARTAKATAARKAQAAAERRRRSTSQSYALAPSDGAMSTARSTVGRSNGTAVAPLDGAMPRDDQRSLAPLDGAYLDIHHLRAADSEGSTATYQVSTAASDARFHTGGRGPGGILAFTKMLSADHVHDSCKVRSGMYGGIALRELVDVHQEARASS